MVHDVHETTTFESFFLSEFPRLVSTLTAWTGSRAVAEDLAQDALVRAEADWERVRSLDKPGAWVRRVALNRASNERRRLGRQARALRRITPIADVTGPTVDDELWNAVRRLPDTQRTAVVLHHVDDLPLADIAEVLGCSVGTVKTHLQRGRQQLARTLGEEAQR